MDKPALDNGLPLHEIDAQEDNSSHVSANNTNSDDTILLNALRKTLLYSPRTEKEFTIEKASDNDCEAASLQIGQVIIEFYFDGRKVLTTKSIVNGTTPLYDQEFLRKTDTVHVAFLSYSGALRAT